MEVEIPIRKFIKRRLFFPDQTEPKCNKSQYLSPVTKLLIFFLILFLLSLIIHYSIYNFWKKEITKFEVTTFCTKYLGELIDDIYVFNGVPYSVSPSLLKLSIKDILGRRISGNSLRWMSSIELKSIETCFASHSNQCIFNDSVWKCSKNRLRKRCINFYGDISVNNRENRSLFNEDCLYLNIKIPKLKRKNLPVIVFIAGTNYATDISKNYGKKYPFEPSSRFVNDVDAIFVSLNYRLGPFGTFYNRNFELENFAISDLLVGFQWIQMNIEKFGGDKNKITLLAHGTGATLGLSILLKNTTLFRSAWLSSGSVYIPNDNGLLKKMSRDLINYIDKRCISNSFYERFCRTMYDELLLISNTDIVNMLSSYYSSKKSLSLLLDTNILLKKERAQNPFFSVDLHSITDSPSNLIYKNVLPSIPIVFTSMLSEFDGFPGEKDWHVKTAGRIEKDISNLFDFIFKLSKIDKYSDLRNRIWTILKRTGQKNKKSLGQIVLEVFSFLRVTCPYLFTAKEIRKLGMNKIVNLIHTEPPAQPVKGMLFENIGKRFPFYGFDIVTLFGKDSLFLKKPSKENLAYQTHFINLFKGFVYNGYLNEISQLNLKKENLIMLNRGGLNQFSDTGYTELCDNLDYKVLNEFLSKIN